MSDSDLNWENVVCEWCGAQAGEIVVRGPDRLLHRTGDFQIIRCNRCGLLRQNPRLTWECLQTFYPDQYISYSGVTDDEPSWFRRVSQRYGIGKVRHAVEQVCRNGRLLDVGCGTGRFLYEMKRTQRWEVVGVEPQPQAVQYARTRVGAQVELGRLLDVTFAPSSFDVITMWHVLEHLDRPIASLACAADLLKPGGWLIISIPNIDSFAAQVFGEYWRGWELPRHLYLFSKSTLQPVLRHLGFSSIYSKCFSMSYAMLGASLEWWSQSWADKYPGLARLMLGGYRSLMMRLLLLLPLWAVERAGRASIVTFFARKPVGPLHG